MILKNRDSGSKHIEELKNLLHLELTEDQQFQVKRELNAIEKGDLGEKDAAYFINFYYGNSKNWIVIHDLRIEHEGNIAQIDHLLFNRLFYFYILESKSYKYGIRITDNGEFEALYNNQYYGIPSPVEQNKRHIHILDNFLRANEILPKRMGITITPNYLNYILISPRSFIKRPSAKKFDTENIIKADTLTTVIDKMADKGPRSISDLTSIAKVCALSTIENLGKEVISRHKISKINWRAKLGIINNKVADVCTKDKSNTTTTNGNGKKFYCAECKIGIPEKAAKFCWNNKKRFGGRAYCYNCQKSL